MAHADVTRLRLRRVKPHEGLAVDSQTWAEAHDYHADRLRLHSLAFHIPGILVGLRVCAGQDKKPAVIVSPGVALDDNGNTIVVGQERIIPLDGVGAGTAYVVLRYRETEVNADPAAPRGAPTNRVVETYEIDALNNLPEDEAYLELARVERSAKDEAVRDAAEQALPGPNEVDQRFRRRAAVRRPPLVCVGFAALGGIREVAVPHALGMQHLLRELNANGGVEAVFGGVVPLAEGTGNCTFLYLEANGPVQPSDVETAALALFLNGGGVLLAERCARSAAEGGDAFVQSMRDLAKEFELTLEPLAPGSPILTSRHVFGQAPPGAVAEGEVLAAGGFVVSTRDYACAWSGLCNLAPLAREGIRSALEFGVNLGVLGSRGARQE